MRLRSGDRAPSVRLVDITGNVIMLGRPGRPMLVCFFGDAACALCSVYVHDLAVRAHRLAALGLDAIVLYGASEESVWRFVSGNPHPFRVVADATAAAHRIYGVERSPWGKLKGIVAHIPTFIRGLGMVGAAGVNANATMPADFLIGRDARIAEAHYGADPGDHIPFPRVEAFARDDAAAARTAGQMPREPESAALPRVDPDRRRTAAGIRR